MLDIPIVYDGTIAGVVCHEHVGSPRQWTSAEQDFSALIASDISLSLEIDRRKAIETNLEHQAQHDALTGLPNRSLLIDRIDQEIKHARRSGSLLAVLFLDLDNFKQINDSFGHLVGDALLVSISGKLKGVLREGDTVSRLGGDEFSIVLTDLEREEDIDEIANKILTVIQQPLTIEDRELFVTTSVGIGVFPEDGDTLEVLLRNADAAMYRAKERGRNGIEFYTEDMTVRALAKVTMIANLKRALVNDEFEVYYQAQYNIDDRELIGLEALVRWNHPELGLISPDQFLPAAEESGLIVALDRWVMRTALGQIQQWRAQEVPAPRVSLNLTMQQIDQEGFLEFLTELIEQTGCRKDAIGFEITEGQLMTNPERTIELLRVIHDLGIEIAIDDFGTGHSSLAYLKKFPVDTIKIDMEFITGLPFDEDDVSIVRTIIALARNMGIDVLAEGVETEAQFNFLLDAGCSLVQGYLLSRPQPASLVFAAAWPVVSQSSSAAESS